MDCKKACVKSNMYAHVLMCRKDEEMLREIVLEKRWTVGVFVYMVDATWSTYICATNQLVSSGALIFSVNPQSTT